MSEPLLVQYFNALPEDALQGVEDLPTDCQGLVSTGPGPKATGGKARRRAVLHLFAQKVKEKYTEGTLLRLAQAECPVARSAGVFALGQFGTLACNDVLASVLHDLDADIADLAADALWRVWFRGDNTAASDDLYRVIRMTDPARAIASLDALIAANPEFAEAFNQRGLLHYRAGRFDLAAKDCMKAKQLNRHHFSAQASVGQCLLRLRRHPQALKAFRLALRVNPRLDSVAATVRALESALGGEELA